jgi:hypothetical protein
MANRSFKTTKGTELPLLNLRGKEYLEVKYRLVWFREDHPDWAIETELINVTDVSAYAKATIRDDSGRIIATSHKFERIQGFPDFIEKAETGSIGRALALIGYGTQFCADELDEGNRIVDAPVQMRNKRFENGVLENRENQSTDVDAVVAQDAVTAEGDESTGSKEPGDYTISFGRKYKGRKLKEIPKAEIESYIKWLENSDVRQGTPLSHQVEYLKTAYDRLYNAEAAAH